jgi:hypothetical protein
MAGCIGAKGNRTSQWENLAQVWLEDPAVVTIDCVARSSSGIVVKGFSCLRLCRGMDRWVRLRRLFAVVQEGVYRRCKALRQDVVARTLIVV